MKGKIGIWVRNSMVKGFKYFNREFVVFAFFLLLSFIFWYLNSLRKVIETELRYPVEYINPPKNRALSDELPSKLTLNLKGPGFSILKFKISGHRAPLVIDFSKVTYKRVPDGKTSDYYVVSGGLIKNFSKQLRSEFEIVSIKPDTLFVSFNIKGDVSTPGKASTGVKKGNQ